MRDTYGCMRDTYGCMRDTYGCREATYPRVQEATYPRVQGGHIHHRVQGGIYITGCREGYLPWYRAGKDTHHGTGQCTTLYPTRVYTPLYHPGYT